jgi:hypothetical protein
MGISGRSFRSSQVVRIDARVLAKIAMSAYDECLLDYCCDPTEMAERLGFDVEMTEGRPEIVGRVLLCPAIPSRRDALEAVYRLLGGFLLNRSNHAFPHAGAAAVIANELMLPRCVASQIESADLPVVQRYVSLDTLLRVYMGHLDSMRPDPAQDAPRLGRLTV